MTHIHEYTMSHKCAYTSIAVTTMYFKYTFYADKVFTFSWWSNDKYKDMYSANTHL